MDLFNTKEGQSLQKKVTKKEIEKAPKTEAKAEKGKKGKKGGKKGKDEEASPLSNKKEKTQELALPANWPEIKSMYVFSKMTVAKDSEHREDYTHMKFVEFLEMVCRLALKEDSRDPQEQDNHKFNLAGVVF